MAALALPKGVVLPRPLPCRRAGRYADPPPGGRRLPECGYPNLELVDGLASRTDLIENRQTIRYDATRVYFSSQKSKT